jgi:hypothetical protein
MLSIYDEIRKIYWNMLKVFWIDAMTPQAVLDFAENVRVRLPSTSRGAGMS